MNRCFTADLDKIGPGQAQYTLCCNDDGRRARRRHRLPRRAGRGARRAQRRQRRARRRAAAGGGAAGITVIDRHRELAVLAVQGPRSAEVLPSPPTLDYMAFVDRDGTVRVCRTGYTGEHGYELLVPWDAAGAVWDGLVAAGARAVRARRPRHPAHRDGLSAARPGPLARRSRRCRRAAAGRSAGASRSSGAGTRWWPRRRPGPARRAARAAGDRPGRSAAGHGRAAPTARASGVTTSGTFSPTLKAGIALALLDAGVGGGRRGDGGRARPRRCRAWSSSRRSCPRTCGRARDATRIVRRSALYAYRPRHEPAVRPHPQPRARCRRAARRDPGRPRIRPALHRPHGDDPLDGGRGVARRGGGALRPARRFDPATMVLHYGQEIFEGLKAYRQARRLDRLVPAGGQRGAVPRLGVAPRDGGAARRAVPGVDLRAAGRRPRVGARRGRRGRALPAPVHAGHRGGAGRAPVGGVPVRADRLAGRRRTSRAG